MVRDSDSLDHSSFTRAVLAIATVNEPLYEPLYFRAYHISNERFCVSERLSQQRIAFHFL